MTCCRGTKDQGARHSSPSSSTLGEVTVKRFSVEVDDDFHEKVCEVLPWGVKSAVFRTILEMVIAGIEREGPVFTGALLSGQIKLATKLEEIEEVAS